MVAGNGPNTSLLSADPQQLQHCPKNNLCLKAEPITATVGTVYAWFLFANIWHIQYTQQADSISLHLLKDLTGSVLKQ